MEHEPQGGPAPLIWTLPPPPGRRGSLDRAAVVAAAIRVADEGGLGALTMSAVAARLGRYSAMALYRYVGDKDGLVDLMLDAACAEVPVPDAPTGDWRREVRDVAAATWAMARRHRWYAELFHTRPPLGPNQMRRTEHILAVLAAAGASTGQAMTYLSMVERYVLGEALQEAEELRMRRRHGLEGEAAFAAAIASMRALAGAGHPRLAEWLAAPSGPGPGERFELGLGWLLDGIAARLR